MNRTTMIAILTVITLLATSFSIFEVVKGSEPIDEVTYALHTSISITDNSEFTVGNGISSGSGTEEDPYIMENWEIDGGASEDFYGITIDSTNIYCIIRNCNLTNWRADGDGIGILLSNVENITIYNCTITENDMGIVLDTVGHCEVNNCFSSKNGENEEGEFTGLVISYSNNITVENNEFFQEYTKGISIQLSEYCTIENNNITECGDGGMDIYDSSNIIITQNLIANCTESGIIAYVYSECIIYDNNIFGNTGYGIILSDTLFNMVYHNNIFDNEEGNACEEFSQEPITLSQWDNGEEGNYWGDYGGEDLNGDGIGETPYNITDGEININEDRYPLVEPYGVPEEPEAELTIMDLFAQILISIFTIIILLIIIKTMLGYIGGVMETDTKKKK